MTKTLVVYYSRTNHTHKIAELIAQGVGANIERIFDAESREGAFGYLRSGREAMLQRPGGIQPVKEDPSDYDLTIIGSPVWSWSLSPPMRSYATARCAAYRFHVADPIPVRVGEIDRVDRQLGRRLELLGE